MATTRNQVDVGLKGQTGSGTFVGSISPTITTPVIVTIKDANGVNTLTLGATVGAVNYMTVINNTTGNPPVFNANGTDTDIGIGWQAKGTGAYEFFGTADTAAIIRLYEDTDSGSNFVGFKAPAAIAGSLVWTLPDADSAGAFTSDGAGNLSIEPIAINNTKNLIIGGNFDTNPWQRNTSFTAPATASYTADRFVVGYSGAMVFNILKTADAPTVAACGMLVSNCYHLDVTTADGSIGATDTTQIETRIEGYNAAQILQRAFTLSFWVKATKTGIYCCYFKNSGNDRSYIAEYTVNSSDTWEYKTITVSASPSAGTWDYTNGIGLRVGWTVAAGSTYQTTAGSWATGNYLATANQVNGVDNTANNFKLALIQVEAGSSATDFEILLADQVLAQCQRYYIKTFSLATVPANNGGSTGGQLTFACQVANANNTASFGISWMYPVKMRATPTITLYNPRAAGTAGQWNNGASDLANAATTFINDQNCLIYDTGATCSVSRWYIQAVASAEI